MFEELSTYDSRISSARSAFSDQLPVLSWYETRKRGPMFYSVPLPKVKIKVPCVVTSHFVSSVGFVMSKADS